MQNDSVAISGSGTSRLYNVASSVLAFLLWGGWAYYVNGKSSVVTGVVSGLTQGAASAVITLFMVRAVYSIYRRLPENIFQIILPGVLTVSFTGSSLAGIHYLAGTPEILFTIVPALTVAFLFCVFTSYKIRLNKSLSEGDALE